MKSHSSPSTTFLHIESAFVVRYEFDDKLDQVSTRERGLYYMRIVMTHDFTYVVGSFTNLHIFCHEPRRDTGE